MGSSALGSILLHLAIRAVCGRVVAWAGRKDERSLVAASVILVLGAQRRCGDPAGVQGEESRGSTCGALRFTDQVHLHADVV